MMGSCVKCEESKSIPMFMQRNSKDFSDQSLDEIRLLKYANKHDHADKYHLLCPYDYFYYWVKLSLYC